MTACRMCPECGTEFDPRLDYAGDRLRGGAQRGYCCKTCRYHAAYLRLMNRQVDCIDEIAVERAAGGDLSITLMGREVAEAWAICERRGMSSKQIGRLLGITQRTVIRWRNGHSTPRRSRPGRAA